MICFVLLLSKNYIRLFFASKKIIFDPVIHKNGNLRNMFGHLDLDFNQIKTTFNFNTNTINELMIYVNKLRIIQ